MTIAEPESSLLHQLLDEQQTLTAVETFSRLHESAAQPAQARYYRELLPTTAPGPGQQYGFQVDLDSCSGCKACVVACHSLNGLDDQESFRDVGLLIGDNELLPVFQHVTTACHHCVEPGCLNACPVNAYEKDPVTGIVRHLDDQCFGCQYCTLACPYDVPKYHADKGIVRKCDMCSQRLAVGEAPACVQACPHQAISIDLVSVKDAREAAAKSRFLPASPDPGYTIPTTRFTGKSTQNPELRPGTYSSNQLEHAHLPLMALLALSQISVGILLLTGLSRWLTPATLSFTSEVALLATAALLALISATASTLHLGRPQYAFRAMLGITHSWLSREIAAFGVYIPLTVLSLAAAVGMPSAVRFLLPLALAAGACGIVCSAMIYHITRRPFWSVGRSLVSFASTVIGTGSAVLLLVPQPAASVFVLSLVCGLAFAVKLFKAALTVQPGTPGDSQFNPLTATATLLQHRLSVPFEMHVLAAAAAVGGSFCLAIGGANLPLAAATLTCGLVAELTEKYLFFRAVVPWRMPGVARR